MNLSPKSCRDALHVLRQKSAKDQLQIKRLQRQLYRKNNKIASIQTLLQDLNNQKLISEDAKNMFSVRFVSLAF